MLLLPQIFLLKASFCTDIKYIMHIDLSYLVFLEQKRQSKTMKKLSFMGDIVTKEQETQSFPLLRTENHFRTCFPFSHLPITKLSCRRNIIMADNSELLKQPLMSNPECDLGGESLGHSSHPFSSHSKHSSKPSCLLRGMQRQRS